MLSRVRSIKTIPSLNKLISGPRTTNNPKKANRQLHCITHEELTNLKFPQSIPVGKRAESERSLQQLRAFPGSTSGSNGKGGLHQLIWTSLAAGGKCSEQGRHLWVCLWGLWEKCGMQVSALSEGLSAVWVTDTVIMAGAKKQLSNCFPSYTCELWRRL